MEEGGGREENAVGARTLMLPLPERPPEEEEEGEEEEEEEEEDFCRDVVVVVVRRLFAGRCTMESELVLLVLGFLPWH